MCYSVNPDCHASYCPKLRSSCNQQHRIGISDKLEGEIRDGSISVINEIPTCVHDIFWVPKDGGGGRTIVDCSRPDGASVNNFTDQVCIKFSYNSVDSVTEVMERVGPTLEIRTRHQC